MGKVSVSENYSGDTATAEVVDYVLWKERIAIANAMIGGWQNIEGFLTYVFPAVYDDSPNLICKNVAYQNHGDIDDETGDWLHARGTFTYGKPDTQVVDYGEIALDVSAEALALPGGMFTWTSGPDTGKKLTGEDITPQVIFPCLEIKLKRKSPYLFLAALVNNIGRLNFGPLIVGDYFFNDSVVLFAGAQVSRKITSEGNDLWDYDMKFICKPFSWNLFVHKSGNLASIAPQIYGYGDLQFFFS